MCLKGCSLGIGVLIEPGSLLQGGQWGLEKDMRYCGLSYLKNMGSSVGCDMGSLLGDCDIVGDWSCII